jgi:alpha-amylase/alpha-mannosidase (GH57 family)
MRYVCVHGHFYQPPRENPSLEAIEVQDSAYPYHDWNERVTAECYARNAVSRILDSQQRILEMVNNYSRISFNFGPTLLSWMQDKAKSVYADIIEADRLSQQAFGGHGSAIAQAYNHTIMPLANRRDKVTQVRWGIKDFQHRFGRSPEGMWLPETAVDLQTLEVLAENGIKFTILAPRQARRVRRRTSRWKDVTGSRIDPSRAYLQRLSARRQISLFFYDGPISQAVAFEGLLDSGERFAERLVGGFSDARDWPQMVHIATDGETYGHHHKFGEMALTYALRHIQSHQLAELTNYGQYLERHPPDHFVEILPNTSWSCEHGVERWRSNCGCNSGGHGGWSQEWRAPLREALDWLRDSLAVPYAEGAAGLLKDPWQARDGYIDVILDRSPENLDRFFNEHAARALDQNEKVRALKLLELQRHALLMYTSCGWFFDELSGLETVQVIHYAGRAVQLAQELFGDNFEGQFVERLRKAKSNIPEHGDGAQIYEKWVKPAVVDMKKLAAHYAISSVFEPYSDHTRIYCYDAYREAYTANTVGKMRLAIGRARFDSEITRDAASFMFGVIHLGDLNVRAGIAPADQDGDYQQLVQRLTEAFSRADVAEVTRLLDERFGQQVYSLKSLFRDEQRKVVGVVLEETLAEALAAYKGIYDNHAPLIRFLSSLGIPLPPAFQGAARQALNGQLRLAFGRPELDIEGIRGLLKEAAGMNVELDVETLEYAIRRRVEQSACHVAKDRAGLESVRQLNRLLQLDASLPFPINLWKAQNIIYAWLAKPQERPEPGPEAGASDAEAWRREVAQLKEHLGLQTTP